MTLYRSFGACFVALACAPLVYAANDVWDGNGANPPNGIWSTAANWGDNTVPGLNDGATFNLPATYTVTFNADPTAIQDLTLSAGNVTFSSAAVVADLQAYSAAGGGGQDILLNGAALTIGTPATGSMRLSAGDDLTVQNGSTLYVTNGGVVSCVDLVTVGAAAGGGSGTINLNDAGFVNGTGTITINATGAVNIIGSSNFNAGNVTINGGLLTSGANGVLNLSTGKTMTIQNGGHATLGGNYDVDNNTTVTGLGSRLDIDGSVYMSASINVLAGADVYSENNATIGASISGSGATVTLTIDGSGSSVTTRSTLTVGHSSSGSATVNVTNGGTLSQLEAETILNPTGTIKITGGTANLGGLVENGGTINFNSGSLSYAGLLTVGSGGLLGENITLFANRQLTVSATTIEPTRQLTVNGGTLTTDLEVRGTLNFTAGTLGGSVRVDGSGIVNTFSSINVPISGNSSSGTINVQFNGISLGSAASFRGFNHQGTLNVGGNAVTLNSAGYARLGALTTLSGGTINAPNGVYVSGGGNLVGNGAVNARVTGDSGSVIEAAGALALGDAASPAGFNYAGELRTKQFAVTLNSSAQATLGNLTALGSGAAAGALTATNGVVVDFGDAISGFGSINSTNTLAKRTIINGVAQGNSMAQPLTFTGYVKGVGTFNNVIFTGTFDPGLSPTILTVGNLGFSATNTLIMELGGTAPGGGYDQIQASGTLGLGGTLAVTLINGFNPVVGNAFNLFDWAGLSGTFSAIQLPTLAPALAWNTSQLFATGVISVAAGITGDFDFDGDVDGRDFLLWQRGGSPAPFSAGDLADWQENYSTPPLVATSVAVPEPTAMALLLVGVIAVHIPLRNGARIS